MNSAPLVLILVTVVGIAKGVHMRKHHPAVYSRLASSRLRVRTSPAMPSVAYQEKYCIIGGGPAGIVMARSLTHEGVPFDWFERHSDLGGLWDIENPGSPMYESAHFISSKYTSGFIGYPMPDSYADYPTWRQVRDYIRDFARAYGLDRKITLSTEVKEVSPLENGKWLVELSNGQSHTYAGVIIASGVNWSPNLPSLPGAKDFADTIRHSVNFRDASEFAGKRVLVVGAGNSGVDIACDAARNAQAAFISVRRGYRYIPKHIFGIPTDALLLGYIDPPKGVSLAGDEDKLIDTLVGDLTRFGLPKAELSVRNSHPIMNTQILHYLGHGDLVAKPDIKHIHADGVEFVDGSFEKIDHIVLATGYEYAVPYLNAPELTWKNGRPQLYLRLFAREYPSLYFIGFAEFADAAYKRFEDMAHMIAMDIRIQHSGVQKHEWLDRKRNDSPDLSGGHEYVDSPRHTGYVDMDTYRDYIATLRDDFMWYDFSEDTYESLRIKDPR